MTPPVEPFDVSKKNTSAIVFMPVILAVYALLALNYLPFTVDDPFITCRYAENLAQGHGLVYNPGERVEGMSNILFTVLVAAGIKCGGDALLIAKLLGILFGAAALLVLFFFSRSIAGGGTLRPLAAPLFMITNVPFLVWSAAGLETTLYLWLLTLGIYLLYNEVMRSRFPWSAIVFGLLSLTRPEGFFLACAIVTAANFLYSRQQLRYTLLWLALFAAIIIPSECWRLWYYGMALPNTVYAKVGAVTLPSMVHTIRYYCLGYIAASGGVALYIAAIIPLAVSAAKVPHVRLCAIAIVLQCLYIITVNGDWMPAYRFFVPVAGVGAILLGHGIFAIHNDVFKNKLSPHVAVALFALILITNFATGHREFKTQFPGFYSWYKNPSYEAIMTNIASNGNYVRMARWINGHVPDKRRTMAIGEAGYIPYATGLRTIDLYGLTNPEVLSLPGIRKDRMGADLVSSANLGENGALYRYLSQKQPDYLLLARFEAAAPGFKDSLLWSGRYVLLHRSGNLAFYGRSDNVHHPLPKVSF